MNIKNEIARIEDQLVMVEGQQSIVGLPKYEYLDLSILEKTLKGKLEILDRMLNLQNMVLEND